jgi:hypothetical protein
MNVIICDKFRNLKKLKYYNSMNYIFKKMLNNTV